MIKTYILIMIISGGGPSAGGGGKTTVTQEFNSLEQCNYVWTSLHKQVKESYYNNIVAGGCFLK